MGHRRTKGQGGIIEQVSPLSTLSLIHAQSPMPNSYNGIFSADKSEVKCDHYGTLARKGW